MKKKKRYRAKVYLRRLLKRMSLDDKRFWLVIAAGLVLIIAGVAIYIDKYAPTKETLSVADYYQTVCDDEAIVFFNGKKMEPEKNATYGNAVFRDDHAYLELTFLKENLDDGYVYDKSAGILRYTTDSETISVTKDEKSYTSGRNESKLDAPIVVEEYDTAYVLTDFVELFTDVNTQVISEAPARVILESAGYEKTTAVSKKNTVMRQFGGPKSKIVSEVAKKETVSVVGSAGKWVWILNDNGILGCVKSSELKAKETTVVEPRLDERDYRHISLDQSICAGWHEVTVKAENRNLESRLAKTKKLNVVIPTWFALADNSGAVSNLASMDYVASCHEKDVQVWGAFSDSLHSDVSTTAVLNNTASRDNLVNNIVASAVAYGMDGVTIDFANVSEESKDGWSEFIRELSLKCENNDLILAVHTGTVINEEAPKEDATAYNFGVLNDYADYVITPDKNEELKPERTVLSVSFYTRAWNEDTQDYSGDMETVDAETQAKKLQNMQDEKLAGAAFWRLGTESDGIWEVVSLYIK